MTPVAIMGSIANCWYLSTSDASWTGALSEKSSRRAALILGEGVLLLLSSLGDTFAKRSDLGVSFLWLLALALSTR